MGITLCDFNICDPEEGRLNVWNQPFTDGDLGKTAMFHSFFPYVLEIAQSDHSRRDSSALRVIRTLSKIDRILSIYPWLRHETSIVILSEKENIPSDHAAVRLVNQKPTHRGHQNKSIPIRKSKHPIFGSILQQLHDDHRFSPDPFCSLTVLPTQSQEDYKTTALKADT